jgi:hypothetical protein
MLLRESGRREEADYDLSAVTDRSRDAGLPHEAWIRALTEQTIGGEWESLGPTLSEAARVMGQAAAVDVLVVASAFNGITRVADATGIPLDRNTAVNTVEMRAAVGLDDFAYDAKSARFG